MCMCVAGGGGGVSMTGKGNKSKQTLTKSTHSSWIEIMIPNVDKVIQCTYSGKSDRATSSQRLAHHLHVLAGLH